MRTILTVPMRRSTDWRPTAGPSPSKVQRLILWVVGLAFTLACFVAFFVMFLVMGEDICLDRSPWWGPPESGTNEECSGHMYQRHEAGYGWFGPGPK